MPNEEKKSSSSVSPLAWIAGALVLIAIAVFAFLQTNETPENPPSQSVTSVAQTTTSEPKEPASTSQNESQDFRMPPFHPSGEGVVLQPTLDPMTVGPAAKAAYQVAKQKPKLLAQLPCFCYCDKFGHGSLHDCYVTDHAQSCDICMKEAIRADDMDKQGMPANQIRDIIVAQFHPTDHSH